jgi:cation transport regulator ChaB
MYDSIRDLPFVCQLNLPEAAQKVYRNAFNRAWREAKEERNRFVTAQNDAWAAVRSKFERDKETGRWMARTTTLEPRVARTRVKSAAGGRAGRR